VSALDKIIVGNVAIQARNLRQFLKKSHYWLTYHDDREAAELWANHNAGGEMLMELRNCSYESAARLATELGLEADASREQPLEWSKWNPLVTVHHDGSDAAISLHRMAATLGLPVRTVEARECGLTCGNGLYSLGMFSLEKLLDLLHEWADQYRKQLDSEP
jgi:hypothetical protein